MPSSKRIGYGAPGVSLREGHEDDGGRARDFVEPCPLGDRTTGSSRSKVIERAPIGLDGHLCGLEALPRSGKMMRSRPPRETSCN